MKSKRLLGFLALAFIASLIYAYLQMPRQERVTAGSDDATRRPVVKKRGQTPAVGAKEGYPLLRSDLLERKSQPYPGVRRNLFYSVFTADKVEESIAILPEEPPAVVVPPVVVPMVPPPPPPQEIARQELSQFKFVGFFKKGEKQTIFLSSAGEIFLVRKGDYLGRDRKYYVLNVTDTTLELRKEGAGDFSIKLTDQESLSAVPLPATQPMSVTPLRPNQEQGGYLPDLPEFQPIPDEAPPTDDQLQPEEDN